MKRWIVTTFALRHARLSLALLMAGCLAVSSVMSSAASATTSRWSSDRVAKVSNSRGPNDTQTPITRGVVDAKLAASSGVASSTSRPERVQEPPLFDRASHQPTATTTTPPVTAAHSTYPTPTSQLLPIGWAQNSDPEIEPERPDPVVAVGPEHVIHSVDSTMHISNRAGGSVLTLSYAQLFDLGNVYSNFDGRVVFDAAHQRWIAAETSWDCFSGGGAYFGHGYLDFAISNSANPTGSWTIYYIPYVDQAPTDLSIGVSGDKLAISADVAPLGGCYVGGGWVSVDLYVLMWSGLLSGAPQADYYTVAPYGGYARQVLLMPSSTPTNTIHELALTEGVTAHYIHQTVTGAVPHTSLTTDPADIGAPSWNTSIKQPGDASSGFGSVDVTSAALVGHRLAFASDYGLIPDGDPDPEMSVRITELNVAAPTGVVVQDFVLSEVGASTFGAAVAFSQAGDLHIAYSRSSATDYLSSYTVYQPAGSSTNTVSSARLIVAGDGVYDGNNWGLTFKASADPLIRDKVWVAVENVHPGSWYTTVRSYDTTIGDTYVPIAPFRILDTRTGTGLTGTFKANIPRSFNVAGAGAGAIPANAVAITGNVTVAGQTAAGYLTVGPSGNANPTSSTINFPLDDNRANNVTLPLNSAGDLAAVYKAAPGKTTQLIVDVTGYFLPDDTGARYHPVPPARVLDSRPAYNIGLSGKFAANTPRTFQVSGHAGVPGGALAVTGNLTVVGQTKAGYVSLTPAPDPNPATSTINFPLGDTRANGVTVPLSGAGKLSAVFKASGGTTDLIFDVTGYYLVGTTGLRFYPINPARIMDTRFNTLTMLFGPFSSSVPRILLTNGHFGVAADALAVTGNLTVVGQTKAGFVSITKDPDATPSVSSLNFPLGDIRANGVTVPLNATNDMAIVYVGSAGATTHLILDLTGYFR